MNPNDASLAELIGELVTTGAASAVMPVLRGGEQRVFRSVMEHRNVDPSTAIASGLRDTLAEILNADLQHEFTQRTQNYFAHEGNTAKRFDGTFRNMPPASRELLEKHRDGHSLVALAAERGQTYRETRLALTRLWARIDRAVADDPDEADLQRFLATGNPSDTAPIFARNKDTITRVLIKRNLAHNREEAEDVYDEACLRALAGLKNFRAEAKVSTWLTRVALNAGVDARKAEKKHADHRLDLDEAADEYQSFFISNERPEDNIELASLFSQLTEGMNDLQLQIIRGRLEGKSVAEMAQEYGVADGTIKSSLSRARTIAQRNKTSPYEDAPRTPTAKPVAEGLTPAERIRLQRNTSHLQRPASDTPAADPLRDSQHAEPNL